MSAVVNGVGFAAASLVLASFCMRSMSTLRWVAIASNLAFIAYGYLAGLAPVLLLHTLLLPVNICRLTQLRSAHIRVVRAKEGMTRDRERLPSRAACKVGL